MFGLVSKARFLEVERQRSELQLELSRARQDWELERHALINRILEARGEPRLYGPPPAGAPLGPPAVPEPWRGRRSGPQAGDMAAGPPCRSPGEAGEAGYTEQMGTDEARGGAEKEPKPAEEPIFPRVLTGLEVVSRAMHHRMKHNVELRVRQAEAAAAARAAAKGAEN